MRTLNHILAFKNRTDNETHLVERTLHAIVLQGTALSTTVAAQTGYLAIQMQISSVCFGQFVGMGCQCHLQGTPRQCGCAHALFVIGHKEYTIALLGCQSTPAYVFAVTHALRLGKIDELVLYGTLVQRNERTCLAVGIVVVGTASVIGVLVILQRQLHGITQTRQ